MGQKLADAKESIDRFLYEARKCAESEYGFAAMLVVFSVILGVSEAVSRKRRNDDLFEWFVSQMSDKESWILLPEFEKFEEDTIGEKLSDIRNALAHQFSLPVDVVMVNSISEVRWVSKREDHRYYIGTREFVEAVRRTVDKIVKSHPSVVLDPYVLLITK